MMRYSINTGLLTRYVVRTCPGLIEVYRVGPQYLRHSSFDYGEKSILSPPCSLADPNVAVLDATKQLRLHGILLRVQQTSAA